MERKTGLVVEGGGMRAIYAAGVLDVLGENGFTFDGVIGVSAGAVHGASFLAGQHGRNVRYYKKYCNDPRFMGISNWIRTGDFVGEEFSYHLLPDELDPFDYEGLDHCGVPYYCVCSNIETGEAEYLQIKDSRRQIDIMRASASLPYCTKPVEIEGKKYLDGGCTDSIPVQAMRKMGYSRNVVVLTQPADYEKKPQNALLAKAVYRKYPNFAKALENRHIMYNKTLYEIGELEKAGEIFVFRPSQPLDISRLSKDPEEIERVYRIGRRNAQKKLDELREFMFLY